MRTEAQTQSVNDFNPNDPDDALEGGSEEERLATADQAILNAQAARGGIGDEAQAQIPGAGYIGGDKAADAPHPFGQGGAAGERGGFSDTTGRGGADTGRTTDPPV